MKIVVIGGTGFIGSRIVRELRRNQHDVLAASPEGGVDTVTGAGLGDALAGAQVVVDVSNAPTFQDAAALQFFETSTRNLIAAGAAAGIRHVVALSIVGTDFLQQTGYFRGKNAQETLIRESNLPYTIVRSTQFFEFLARIADAATVDGTIRLPSALIQPIAADDVAATVAAIAAGPPLNTTIEISGPEAFRFDAIVRENLAARQDARDVVVDPQALYFGAFLDERTLIPGEGARIAATRFSDWLGAPPAS